MARTLKQSQTITAIAEILYSFLPGSGRKSWKGHVSFKTIATRVGVGDFWPPGSKMPAIKQLLENTLLCRPHLTEKLLYEIVNAGLDYRRKNDNPVSKEEILKLNGLLLDIDIRVPDLWDSSFLDRLDGKFVEKAAEKANSVLNVNSNAVEVNAQTAELELLKNRFFSLLNLSDRQKAGFEFEHILNSLFHLFKLSPRNSFRVIGEQIDGSFEMDHETYLVEAKWEKNPVSENPLCVFREKISAKSHYTRGVFIAYNGITEEAKDAITRGKQPLFFVMDGYDLSVVLQGQIALDALIRQKQRVLAEEGLISVLYNELWTGSRARK